MSKTPFYNFIYILLITVSCSIIPKNAIGQTSEGTEFWFGFMQHAELIENQKKVIIVTKSFASGVIEIPEINFKREFTVTPGLETVIDIPKGSETQYSGSIENKGIHVYTTSPVYIYIQQFANNKSEASFVLPIDALGTDYFLLGYPGTTENNEQYYSEGLIIATENNTKVKIKFSADTENGFRAKSTNMIVLDKGQTYFIKAKETNGDMTGTKISSNKNISVFSGTELTKYRLECQRTNSIMEQMHPVKTWGKTYVSSVPTFTFHDFIRILASEDDTQILFVTRAGTNNYVLNEGEMVEIYSIYNSAYIESSKPITIANFIVSQPCEIDLDDFGPSMSILSSFEQSKDTILINNVSSEGVFQNNLSVTIKKEDLRSVTVNGDFIFSNPKKLLRPVFDSTYIKFELNVSAGPHTIIAPGCGAIVQAYGIGQLESHIYGGGANFVNINEDIIPDGGCLNDTVFFQSSLPLFKYDVQWDFGDGTTSDLRNPQHIYTALGTYNVVYTYTDICCGKTTNVEKAIDISLRNKVVVIDSISDCFGADIVLSANDISGVRYEWNGPNEFSSNFQNPDLHNISNDSDGDYQVIATLSGCATFPATTHVNVVDNLNPNLPLDTTVCDADFPIALDPGFFESYEWSTGEVSQQIDVTGAGLYAITLSDDQGCLGFYEINVKIVCQEELYVPNVFSPNGDGINDHFTIGVRGIVISSINIFDRWGNIVYSSKAPDIGWDGTVNGSRSSQGVYVYFIEYEGRQENGDIVIHQKAGSLTLLRNK